MNKKLEVVCELECKEKLSIVMFDDSIHLKITNQKGTRALECYVKGKNMKKIRKIFGFKP